MAHYVALVNYTDKGIANVKPGFSGWIGVRPAPSTNFKRQIKILRQVG